MPDDAEAPIIRIAILSDLHAYEGDPAQPPSTLKDGSAEDDPGEHPVVGFEALIDNATPAMTADLLLCPGDLGDRASPVGVRYGWRMIDRLGAKLGASVVATVGNHDVHSRHVEGEIPPPTPVETLKSLAPRFPYRERAVQQAFFSDGYAIIEDDHWRVASVNSSMSHGYGDNEYEFGRVTPRMRRDLVRDLTERGRKSLNVLLCHHHPIEYTDADEGDRSSIVGGPLLMNALVEANCGPWLVVHGHKHLPNLAYGPGGGDAPIVFSAGSFSANLHLTQQPRTRNQAYMVEVDLEATARLDASLVGRFRSWYWVNRSGWSPTAPGSGLPALGGFGARVDPEQFASDIVEAMTEADVRVADWDRLVSYVPEIEFLIPSDLQAVQKALSRRNCRVLEADSGRLAEVGR